MIDDRFVFCPLVDEKIEDIDCIEHRDNAHLSIQEEDASRFTAKDDWREICKKCKWHNY